MQVLSVKQITRDVHDRLVELVRIVANPLRIRLLEKTYRWRLPKPLDDSAHSGQAHGRASQSTFAALEAIVTLRFIGIDPNTDGNNCPSVWVDEKDGSIVVQGGK